MMEEKGKSYLILGASSDIGMAFLRSLAEKHPSRSEDSPLIVAHYHHNRQRLDDLQRQCRGLWIEPVQADLGNEEDMERFLRRTEELVECPDVILHLPAAPFSYMRYKEFDTDRLRTELGVQLFSFLAVTKAFLPNMQKREGSRVLVMLTSYVNQELPPKFMADYVISKYALLGAMKAAAAEFGGKKLKINGISPIMMDTKFLSGIDPRIKEMNAFESPLGRIPGPEEFVPFLEEMLSPDYEENGLSRLIDETALMDRH